MKDKNKILKEAVVVCAIILIVLFFFGIMVHSMIKEEQRIKEFCVSNGYESDTIDSGSHLRSCYKIVDDVIERRYFREIDGRYYFEEINN